MVIGQHLYVLTKHEETDANGKFASSVVSGKHVSASRHGETLSETEENTHDAVFQAQSQDLSALDAGKGRPLAQ